jgi:hypothetical protein
MSFWYLQFFHKTNKTISSWIVFVHFLKELKIQKRHFEINWPLVVMTISIIGLRLAASIPYIYETSAFHFIWASPIKKSWNLFIFQKSLWIGSPCSGSVKVCVYMWAFFSFYIIREGAPFATSKGWLLLDAVRLSGIDFVKQKLGTGFSWLMQYPLPQIPLTIFLYHCVSRGILCIWVIATVLLTNFHKICILKGPKIKETNLILRNIYYCPQSKKSISLKVGEETKLLTDSAFGNSLCTRGYMPKSKKPFFFFLASHAPWNWATTTNPWQPDYIYWLYGMALVQQWRELFNETMGRKIIC